MLIVSVCCLAAAAVCAGLGVWTLTRPTSGDPGRTALRAVAPTQLAAAVMLAAGGVAGIAASPRTGLVVIIVCVIGAVATVAAGSWQGAKYAFAAQAAAAQTSCAGACATCTLSCR